MRDGSVDLERALAVARAAALAAGAIQKDGFSRELTVVWKGEIDLVTEVDKACEAQVERTIFEAFPDHRILGEEEGERGGDSPCRWIVDPLDGTTNFAHRFPLFCVSLALEVSGVIQLGVVYVPMLEELFVARRGRGATLNGQPLSVSKTETLVCSMLTTGFAYDVHHAARNNLDHFADFTTRAQATRRTGTAAFDLCCVAAGRFDGFWEIGLRPWDMAAGALMVTEAGGRMSRFDGAPLDLFGRETVGSNGLIHDAMLGVLAGRA